MGGEEIDGEGSKGHQERVRETNDGMGEMEGRGP